MHHASAGTLYSHNGGNGNGGNGTQQTPAFFSSTPPSSASASVDMILGGAASGLSVRTSGRAVATAGAASEGGVWPSSYQYGQGHGVEYGS